MRESGHMLATVLAASEAYAQVGMTTKDLADFAATEIKKTGGHTCFFGAIWVPRCHVHIGE